jgi:predicted ester cyclase
MVTLLSDYAPEIEDLIVSGNRVVARVTSRAKHTGPFAGIAPTGKEIIWTSIYLFRLCGGRIAEMWWQEDFFGMLEQLGFRLTPPESVDQADP